MGSLVLTGDTSGSVTVAVPAVAGTNTATFPAATGTVMVSGNMPAFSAYQSSTQNVANATSTKILFQTEVYDTNNNFASSTFTPTVAGYYQITGSWTGIATAANLMTCYIFKNGGLTLGFNGGLFYISGSGNIGAQMSALIYLNGSTDYVEFYGYQTGTTSMTTVAAANGTYFQACLVRGA
jgi:hypothetical protein